jgi:aminoglycoside phosphotransferase (APT) family kinase protein
MSGPPKMETTTVPADLSARVAGVTGRMPAVWQSVRGGGYTSALRLRVVFMDGASAFVKAAVSEDTAGWIRQERRVYEDLRGAPFLPTYYGADETNDGLPFLVLEDLTGAHWPPPWTEAQIQAVREALDRIHAARPALLPALPTLTEVLAGDLNWREVASESAYFLSLGFCSPTWLEAALPALIAASEAAPKEGETFLHLDVRSDNICLRPNGAAVFVDWNWVCRGNPIIDLAGWLPSLSTETGILPETILPDAPEWAAWFAGFWAYKAGRPGPPHLRAVQKRQLSAALPWAVRALDLPPLDRAA